MSHEHVESFLNASFKEYMQERNVSVVMSRNLCCHQIAVPDKEDGTIELDFCSVSARNGSAEDTRENKAYAVCACTDGTSFEELSTAWICIEEQKLLDSARSFARLLKNLHQDGLLSGDLPPFAANDLIEKFNKSEFWAEPAQIDADDRDCVAGLTD